MGTRKRDGAALDGAPSATLSPALSTAPSITSSSSRRVSSLGDESRSLARVAWASGMRPRRQSQRGDSMRMAPRRSWRVAGTTTTPSTRGHKVGVPSTEGRPSTCAMSMATTTVSWKAVPTIPRRWAGDTSPRYMGTTTVEPPHALPVTKRPIMSTATRSQQGPPLPRHSWAGTTALEASSRAPRP